MMGIFTTRATSSMLYQMPTASHELSRFLNRKLHSLLPETFDSYKLKLNDLVVTPIDIQKFGNIRYKQFERFLRPGGASQSGFINRTESLADIYFRDLATTEQLGISFLEIALVIERLINPLLINNDVIEIRTQVRRAEIFTVNKFQYRGFQQCPFENYVDGCDQKHTSCDFIIKTGRGSLKISGLVPHLLRTHHFCEGSVSYRIDPANACHILGIQGKSSEDISFR